MYDFILEEKHEYWDNKITLEEYIKNLEECGYIDCSSDFEYEYWYILENLKKANNLQSKIDKAYDYLDKFIPNEYGVLLTERQWNYAKSILKEDK